MAWIPLVLYVFIALVVWPIIARQWYAEESYKDAGSAVGYGLLLSTIWPILGFMVGFSWLFNSLIPKLFRMN